MAVEGKINQYQVVRNGMGMLYLVHIIPDVHSACALSPTPLAILPSTKPIQALVPLPAVRIKEVDPSTASTPAPPFELTSMLVLDE